MNVLLTCAGRRNYLVSFFREALGAKGRVFAADAQQDAPALAEADGGFVVPRVDHPDYVSQLIKLCKANQVTVVIPLNDLELPGLAKQRSDFLQEGILPVVSAPEVVEVCFDKSKSYEFLSSSGLPVADAYQTLGEAQEALSREELRFPLVVKPRWGSASIGIEQAQDTAELELAYSLARRKVRRSSIADISSVDSERCILLQRVLHGEEYGLDVVNDLEGNYVATFIKRKLGMRAGETDRAVTVKDLQLEQMGATLGTALKHVGNLDVDVIVEDGVPYVLEMNPRFGGGYPFSHMAGANLPAALIAWTEGKEPDPTWLKIRSGVTAAKCDRLVVIQE